MPRARRFDQVDVFTEVAFLGNPLAVIHDADDLTEGEMARIANWTNLSETTFVCAPTTPEADYRVRIFTTGGELPFAGHPTLGTAAAWLRAGGIPRDPSRLVQDCGAGLVQVRQEGERLAFAAPPLRRSGPVADELVEAVLRALQVDPSQVRDLAWIDNGPGWIGVDLGTAQAVLELEPDVAAFTDLQVTVLGRHDDPEAGADVEVRAFYAEGRDFSEDPVTGSANAGLAQWLVGAGALPSTYVARQGTRLGRAGRVFVEHDGTDIWVGGAVTPCVTGQIEA